MRVASMKSSERRARKTAFGLLVASGLVGLAMAPVQSGCATQTTTVSTRALERSGRASFVCLGKPVAGESSLRPITDCNATTVLSINDYTTEEDGGAGKDLPHLYALVTQTTRGEVAVIDTTSINNYVLDQDPSVPGANFLPIGAQPIDIVSTPGSTATFVGVAEIGREGLFALPSTRIRPASANGTGGAGGSGGSSTSSSITLPEISSWPSCRLPAAPGQMLLVPDPAGKASPTDKAATRPCCDAPYGAPADDKACSAEGAGAGDEPRVSGLNGDIEAEGKGRQKLVVTIPSRGGVAVIDAQELLDSKAGAYEPCHVERWLPLSTTVPDLPPKPPTGGAACVDPKSEAPELPAVSEARPTTLAYAAGRLYASDLDTSLIHVVDLPTPCEPVEVRPLLPTSLQEPKRAVTTSHVAVAPTLTPDLKRYLYAIDDRDGSAMVFDVSDDQASQFPLQRPRPEWNPFAASDRIFFGAPVADLLIATRDIPESNPATGTAPEGLRCDPNPALTVCLPTSQSCDLATAYRTDVSTYTSGAGPAKLRGTFAFLALTSGRVAVVDIDDFDAPCRGPVANSPLFGCPPGPDWNPNTPDLVTSNELSCNVVLPNTPRSANYYAPVSAAGLHQAGIQGYPQLFDAQGAPLEDSDPSAPKLIATVPPSEVLKTLPQVGSEPVFQVSVSGSPVSINVASGSPADSTLAGESVVMMNLEDPHAQIADQNWFITFEGGIPGFDQRLASLDLPEGASAVSTLRDASSRFCEAGVQSKNAVLEKLPKDPASEAAADRLADYVQIQNELPDPDDRYWTSKKEGTAEDKLCTFDLCRGLYGSFDVPAAGRDFKIIEATQDHLEILPRIPASFANKGQSWQTLTKCCFPSLVTFSVRVGDQWEVAGDQSGFLHHVIADPATGVCRDSCDPTLSRKNGRAQRVPNASPDHNTWPVVPDGSPRAFINPMFRFAVVDPPAPLTPVLGQQFRFITQGAFKPVLMNLSADGTSLIQPVGMSFVTATGQLAVTDGSINGLLFVDFSLSAVSRTFF
jgi:hypothetical protein